MDLQSAIEFIRPGITPDAGVWADIGAGTGTFTEALFAILTSGRVIAADKSPHSLYKLTPQSHIAFEIVDADFTQSMSLPLVDGILMVNALHYAADHAAVLQNVLQHLKPGGTFLLIEYDTEKANPPWVPFPVSLRTAEILFAKLGLQDVRIIGKRGSIYQDGEMYALKGKW